MSGSNESLPFSYVRDETVEWVKFRVDTELEIIEIEWLKLLYFRSPADFFLVLFFGGMVDWEFRVSMQAQQQVDLSCKWKLWLLLTKEIKELKLFWNKMKMKMQVQPSLEHSPEVQTLPKCKLSVNVLASKG